MQQLAAEKITIAMGPLEEHINNLRNLHIKIAELGFVGDSAIKNIKDAAITLDNSKINFANALEKFAPFIPDADSNPLLAAGIILELAHSLKTSVLKDPLEDKGKSASSLLSLVYTPTQGFDYRVVLNAIQQTPLHQVNSLGNENNILAKILSFTKDVSTNSTLRNTAVAIILNKLIFTPEPGQSYANYECMLQPTEYTWNEQIQNTILGPIMTLPNGTDQPSYLRLVAVIKPNGENNGVNYIMDYSCPVAQKKYGEKASKENDNLAFGREFGEPFSLSSEEVYLKKLTEISNRQLECDDLPMRYLLALEKELRTTLSDINIKHGVSVVDSALAVENVRRLLADLENISASMGNDFKLIVFDRIKIQLPETDASKLLLDRLSKNFNNVCIANDRNDLNNDASASLSILNSSTYRTNTQYRSFYTNTTLKLPISEYTEDQYSFIRALIVVELAQMMGNNDRYWISECIAND